MTLRYTNKYFYCSEPQLLDQKYNDWGVLHDKNRGSKSANRLLNLIDVDGVFNEKEEV